MRAHPHDLQEWGPSLDLANLLLADFRKHVTVLEHHPQTQPPPEIQRRRQSFKH